MRYWVYNILPTDNGWEYLPAIAEKRVPEAIREGARRVGWEGTVQQTGFRIFLLPTDVDWAPGFAWKQVGNGETFIASPFPLEYLIKQKVVVRSTLVHFDALHFAGVLEAAL